MIIHSDEEIRQKQDSAPESTVRTPSESTNPELELTYPPQAFRRRAGAGAYHSNALPDYETSQALAINLSDAASYFKPDPTRFDRRFWRAALYGFAFYLLCTIVVGIPLIVYFKRRASQFSPPPPGDDTYYIVDSWRLTSNNYERVLLGGKKAQCPEWDHAEYFPITPGSSGTRFRGSSSRNISILGDIYLRSNGSYAFAVDSDSTGDLHVDMNPDPSVKNVVLKWEVTASDPGAANSVCFSDLDAAGTLLDFQVPETDDLNHYAYQITLLFPQSNKMYKVPVLSTLLPYFTTTFGRLEPGPSFSTVNIQGSAASASFGYLKAQHVLVKLGQGDITGNFHIDGTLNLDTLNAGVNVTATLVDHSLSSAMSIGTGNGPINAKVTLVPANFTKKSPVYMVNLRTFNAPLTAEFTYAPQLPPPSLQVRASTMLAPATITVDPKYQGQYNLDTFLAESTLTDRSSDAPNRLSLPQISSRETKTGWIGWKGSQADGGQSSVEMSSSRDMVTLRVS